VDIPLSRLRNLVGGGSQWRTKGEVNSALPLIIASEIRALSI